MHTDSAQSKNYPLNAEERRPPIHGALQQSEIAHADHELRPIRTRLGLRWQAKRDTAFTRASVPADSELSICPKSLRLLRRENFNRDQQSKSILLRLLCLFAAKCSHHFDPVSPLRRSGVAKVLHVPIEHEPISSAAMRGPAF
jgi:hypothetical protein